MIEMVWLTMIHTHRLFRSAVASINLQEIRVETDS